MRGAPGGGGPPSRPPRFLRWALERILPPGAAQDGLLGDLDELYAERAGRGRIAATLWYARQVASAAGHYALRQRGTGVGSDLALAARTLLRTPSFTAAAVGTLALGIGANAAVFGLVDEVLLQPPPYERPDELVLVWTTLGPSGDAVPVPAPDAAAVEARVASFAGLAFMARSTDATLAAGDDGTPEHARMAGVTPDFFDVLGVQVARGRGFLEEDAAAGVEPGGAAQGGGAAGPPAVLITDAAWRRVFAADPSLPGRTVRLNARPVVVLGVLPPDFRMMLPPWSGIDTDVDVWVPLRVPLSEVARSDGRWIDQDTDNSGAVVARLADGASLANARAELDLVSAILRYAAPEYATRGYALTARPLHEDATAHARGLLLALLAGAAGVLVVAALGVSALLLARGLARERELAVRTALGASRWLLVRHLLAEVVIVLAGGGAVALLVAVGAGRALAGLVPAGLGRVADAAPGDAVLFVVVATAALAPVLGVIALLQARLLAGRARAGALLTRGRFRRGRAREVLVVAEVAVSLVLVAAAGLLVRAGQRLTEVEPGFRAEGALGLDVSVRVEGAYTGPAERARLVRSLEEAVEAVPGVSAVGLTNALPLSGRRWMQPWGLPGQPVEAWGGEGRADFRMVTSSWFAAVGTELLEGRTFTSDEDVDEGGGRVVIVDRALAEKIAPSGGTALDARIGIPLDGRAIEARVVGVVEDVRNDDLATPGRGTIYVPYRQEASRDVSFVVRTTGDAAALAPAVRSAVHAVEPRLAVYGVRTLDDLVRAELAPTLFGVAMLAAYALLALLAAALGLYGVVAWEVGRRTRDLGVRMAVGATSEGIRRAVLANGLRLAAVGVACGGALAVVALGGLRRLVYGVPLADPPTWAAAVVVVVAVTTLACWIPAARAARLDPVEALRSE